ncbi:hypothetical protein B0H10DRAFT_607530 [Mycena sp. CBHHK59/15]|nr:hypothetical protein B0H10DRAFT_607530 [Mycena sp. CBHHK59/15]
MYMDVDVCRDADVDVNVEYVSNVRGPQKISTLSGRERSWLGSRRTYGVQRVRVRGVQREALRDVGDIITGSSGIGSRMVGTSSASSPSDAPRGQLRRRRRARRAPRPPPTNRTRTARHPPHRTSSCTANWFDCCSLDICCSVDRRRQTRAAPAQRRILLPCERRASTRNTSGGMGDADTRRSLAPRLERRARAGAPHPRSEVRGRQDRGVRIIRAPCGCCEQPAHAQPSPHPHVRKSSSSSARKRRGRQTRAASSASGVVEWLWNDTRMSRPACRAHRRPRPGSCTRAVRLKRSWCACACGLR